jgi:phosphate-selective porin OprO/OprP
VSGYADSFRERKLAQLTPSFLIRARRVCGLIFKGAASKAKKAPVFTAGREGFSLKSADGSYQLRIRGYLQGDGRFFADDQERANTDSFLLRRVRPILEGTVAKHFDFRIMTDFGGGTATVQDAYIDARFWPEAKLRVGKYKPPVGLERLQSGSELLFVERGLPTNLVPNRDVGAQIHGDLFEGAFRYALVAKRMVEWRVRPPLPLN